MRKIFTFARQFNLLRKNRLRRSAMTRPMERAPRRCSKHGDVDLVIGKPRNIRIVGCDRIKT
jgi:hypothetical protein